MTASSDTNNTVTGSTTTIEVTGAARAEVNDFQLDVLRRTIDKILGMLSEPVTSVSALVSTHPTNDPAHQRRVRATIGLRGDSVRAETWGAGVEEAADRLGEKLRHQVDARSDRFRHDPHGRPAEPGHWRHGFLPTERPSYFQRPPTEREVVRQVSLAGGSSTTLEEAQWDQFQLGYDFFLFHDADTDLDTLLVGQDTNAEILRATEARNLSVEGAREWLDGVGDEFVFFVEADSDRGAVLYRRHDGHYGLITTS